jgi:hypothetical protein
MLPEAISEALGISLSEVFDLYFRDIDEVKRERLVWDTIDRRREDVEEGIRFEENSRREWEAELASYIGGDDTF